MILIENIKSLDEILKHYFLKNTKTNSFVLASDYQKYIREKKLFYTASSSNMCFFIRKDGFYRLYYYLNNQDELFEFNQDKPIVMEILYRGELLKPYDIIKYWENCGFKQHLVRDNMTAVYNQIKISHLNNSEVKIKYVDSEVEILFTKELIETTLDKYTGDILSIDEVIKYSTNKNIVCAYFKEELCGILQYEIKNKVVWLGHVAVSSKFRGKGIAKELVNFYVLNNAIDSKTYYQLWVIQNNVNATTLYQKYGFRYGNKSSASMLKLC